MSEKVQMQKGQAPQRLTAADIRSRVEVLAEELTARMRPADAAGSGFEAYAIDTRKFVIMMADYVGMN